MAARKRRRVRKPRRPWRLTCESGCLSTFTYRDHAVTRGRDLVASGRIHRVFVKNRDETSVLEISVGSSQWVTSPTLFDE